MNRIITIARQFGSAGRDIARLAADTLGFAYYDKEIVLEAVKKSNLDPTIAGALDETATNSLLYSIAAANTINTRQGLRSYAMPLNDRLFFAECEVVKQFARQGDCVILGRCADYILADEPDLEILKVFVSAPRMWRVNRVAKELGLDERKAKEEVTRTDRRRRNYYEYYSGNDWGKTESYDLCINSSRLGIEKSARVVSAYFESTESK